MVIGRIIPRGDLEEEGRVPHPKSHGRASSPNPSPQTSFCSLMQHKCRYPAKNPLGQGKAELPDRIIYLCLNPAGDGELTAPRGSQLHEAVLFCT